ncbi:MAG: AMP-binding protein [Lachnospiraceae bacterium]|nr:AMP-binding protein [Lachnospiraceae bacterium]
MTTQNVESKLLEVAARIREMREIAGLSEEQMARLTEVSVSEYRSYEAGENDFPFTFIHKCALALQVEIPALLEGHTAKLRSYTVTRKGQGQVTAKEDGILIKNLAPMFKNKLAEPYWVRYDYSAEQQKKPIHLTRHSGQEFDLVLKGCLKVQVGDHVEILQEGDSILYNSSTPHGMIAINEQDCTFLAFVLPGEKSEEQDVVDTLVTGRSAKRSFVSDKYVKLTEDAKGRLKAVDFPNQEEFNFAFDIVDAIARKDPDKLAMIHLDKEKNERRFTFQDMSRMSNQCANYFKSIGIKRGDNVMLVLKRHYQFWVSMLALHKLGAVAIPATNQLLAHDFEYRFNAASVKAILCTADGDTAHQAEQVFDQCPSVEHKLLVGGAREGWRDFNAEYVLYSSHYEIPEDRPQGSDRMLMFFTSGTTGYPKIAAHSYKYALGHYVTAKYWHQVDPDGLHLTISDTGWGKALWGKLYGQWMCEGPVFTYDFDRFHADDILPLFAQYHITTFCAPPTMYRMLIKEDISKYDLSSIVHATTAGEALNPEVYKVFKENTGLRVMEGFGQTETTLVIGNLYGEEHKLGSMGKPSPQYHVDILGPDDKPVPVGENGEICIYTNEKVPCGLFLGYYRDEELTKEAWHDGVYHTGDVAWKDEDGFYWYVGRKDDVIKSSGYRIGPFEIESVIMELPYVLECGVSAAPDPVRGQVVKASIVLTKGTEGTEELKKEIQNYVKTHTAPYKYPRIVVFMDELPKTISGKIQRNKL